MKVMRADGRGSGRGGVAGMEWVKINRENPAIVSMSLTSPRNANRAWEYYVNRMVWGGITVVAAAGNQGTNVCNYGPAWVSRAITVASSTIGDEKSDFSNYGSCADIFAPGSHILSAYHESD